MTPDFSCERCQDALPWYVAGSLADLEQSEIERHLASCPACRLALAEWREVSGASARDDARIPRDTEAMTTWVGIRDHLRRHDVSLVALDERHPMRLSERPTPPTHIGSEPKLDRRRRPAARGRPFVAIAATVALVAISAVVFTLLSSGVRSGVAVTPTRTAKPACLPSKATADLPTHASLSAIAPSGTDDGWAVGRVWDPQAATPPATLMLRLQNCHWAPVGTPIPSAELLSVSMASADEGWAVGATMRRDTLPLNDHGGQRNDWLEDQLLVLHYTGGTWRRETVTTDTQMISARVKMVSANEGWMLIDHGKRMTIVNSTTAVPSYAYTLLHLQGSTWSDVPLSFQAPSMILDDLDAKVPGECWVVGYDVQGSGGGVAAHYVNGSWQRWVGAGGKEPTDVFYSVSEVGPNDVWAAGNDRMYHFDGTAWAEVPVAGTAPNGMGIGIQALQVLATGEGWAFDGEELFGQDAFHQAVLHYRNGQWSWELLSLGSVSPDTPISFLSGIALVSPTQGWAIADRMVPTDIGATVQGMLLYYDSGTWGTVEPHA